MDKNENTPRPGEIFYLTKDKPYQIVTIGIHKETYETMVVYQALYGGFETYVLPLSKFIDEMQGDISTIHEPKRDNIDIQEPDNKHIASKANEKENVTPKVDDNENGIIKANDKSDDASQDKVSQVLLSFLDADSYSNKLEIITTHINEIDDRLINNMAASLDCTVEDGPMEQRVQGLIYCLKQLSRFEVKRLR